MAWETDENPIAQIPPYCTIARRFPRRLILWPVAVQGAGSAEQIAAAIRGFGALPRDGSGAVPQPDVLIVARGGGSPEELAAFNDELVHLGSLCRVSA